MPKTLEELEEWARLLRKESHPLAETMEEIAEGWRADKDLVTAKADPYQYDEEADARLIAAAPDMLKMLEDIALEIRRGQDISECYSEIADTIEKAKGEQE